jgi:3-oxocholest-4-en-26-oyl-CoA dehydrogenase alpha subunit
VDFSIIELDADTRAFWDEVRAFLDTAVTPELAATAWDDGSHHDWGFHEQLGARGWITYEWSAELGGAGLTGLRARLLGLELWRCAAPGLSRVSTVQIANSLLPWIDERVRDSVVRAVAAGTICLCQGITEPGCGSDAAAATTRAIRDGENWVITGQKMFTTNAQNSRYCMLLTRTDGTAPKHAGLTVFLVPLDSPGIQIEPIQTLGGDRTNLVFYDEVVVPDSHRLGPVNDGWRVLNTQLDAEHGMTEGDLVTAGFVYADMLRELVDAAIKWAAREGPDGSRPIDRADVEDALARAAIDVELAMITPEPMRRLHASQLLNQCASRLFDLLGPASLLVHGSTGSVADGMTERWLRQAPATSIYGGTTEVFLNLIAEKHLGLPHHRHSIIESTNKNRSSTSTPRN